jgi:hypothetical protein
MSIGKGKKFHWFIIGRVMPCTALHLHNRLPRGIMLTTGLKAVLAILFLVTATTS